MSVQSLQSLCLTAWMKTNPLNVLSPKCFKYPKFDIDVDELYRYVLFGTLDRRLYAKKVPIIKYQFGTLYLKEYLLGITTNYTKGNKYWHPSILNLLEHCKSTNAFGYSLEEWNEFCEQLENEKNSLPDHKIKAICRYRFRRYNILICEILKRKFIAEADPETEPIEFINISETSKQYRVDVVKGSCDIPLSRCLEYVNAMLLSYEYDSNNIANIDHRKLATDILPMLFPLTNSNVKDLEIILNYFDKCYYCETSGICRDYMDESDSSVYRPLCKECRIEMYEQEKQKLIDYLDGNMKEDILAYRDIHENIAKRKFENNDSINFKLLTKKQRKQILDVFSD